MVLDLHKIHKKEDGSVESINRNGTRTQLNESTFPVRVEGSVLYRVKPGVYGPGDPVELED
jgi:hypothetical protein